MSYDAPVRHMRFLMEEVFNLADIASLPGFEEATPETVAAILEEAARFAGGELAPLNAPGDRAGARLEGRDVVVPEGFAAAYRAYAEAGWNAVACDPAHGGMGLPALVATATQEMWQAANLSFSLCPMLTAGAIEALERHGSEAQQARYLPRLVSGEWTGTMDLTEPQAGSDLGAIRTRAERRDDHYRIFGQKIYITWGEHGMTDNIVHLVLARTPDAPAGVRGISMFIVPKYLPDAAGQPGERNDMYCGGIEHKLGIHASPTCTMIYGETDGAVGYLVGEEGRGLEYMFTMMNEARHKVGMQGLSIAERAYQQAAAYAAERTQGRTVSGEASIVGHPDVRRMLLTMKSCTEAMRALCYAGAAAMDRARRATDGHERGRQQARADLLIPVIKAWCTELGIEVASLGIQVHGGMGYIEETGAAQYLRDARIAAIYEGTNGIQANDFMGRKLLRDSGAAMTALLDDMAADVDGLGDCASPGLSEIGSGMVSAIAALRRSTARVLENAADDPAAAGAAAFPLLMQTGFVAGGWLLARAARVAAGSEDDAFNRARVDVARFYAAHVLPRAEAHGAAARSRGGVVAGVPTAAVLGEL
ncbi:MULTISPECIES: acyl-CoA dehydrogenase [Arhodomonas]|uniref:acyl-CoA dehydrogenase n=1 Tax=Arhodomonas TaxID=2368 RepID=UPI0003692232|nr:MULTISPECIES: acyl-CoA dehydrogenase [Arhodomonas]